MGSRTTIAVVAALLAGCATQPLLPSIGGGEPISLAGSEGPGNKIELRNNAMGQSAGSGTSRGAVIGGLWGLACGPLAIICVPAGAGLASGIGALSGMVVGSFQGLPEDSRKRLMSASAPAGNPQEELLAAITALARSRWTVASGSATTVTVRVDELALNMRRGERIVVTLKATITVTRGTSEPESKTFSYMGPESDARLWLDDRDGFVADSFRHAYRHLALDIVSELSRSNGPATRS